MKQMTWEDYYDGFYDWAPSTQKSYTYRLSDFGPADEVWEIAQELSFNDDAFAAKFLEKAFAAGVRFTPDQVLEMVGTVEESVLSRMAEQTDVPFNREQLEEIYQEIQRQYRIKGVKGVSCSQEMINACPAGAISEDGIDRKICQAYCKTIDEAIPSPDICGKCFFYE